MNLFQIIRHHFLQLKWRIIFRKSVGVLGDFTVVNPLNVKIGFNCGINHDVFILGAYGVDIGANVVLSARCMLIDSGLDLENYSDTDFPPHTCGKITLDDGVWIGAGAIILAGVTIGKKSVVGAGSVVTTNVPPFTIVAGNPARPIGRTDA